MLLYQIYKENEFGGEAKYLTLVNAVKKAIEKGELNRSDCLPSINNLRKNLGLGKDTILKAIERLKEEGVIIAVHGKGFYVEKTNLSTEFRLFILFDEFSAYKRNLYHSMLDGLKGKGEIQIFFHHYNAKIFSKLLKENVGNYTHYLIMPFPNTQVLKSLDLVPCDKLYILDRNEILPEGIPAVFQDYENDVYEGFYRVKDKLQKYSKLFLVYPPHSHHPGSIITGFEKVCNDLNIDGVVIESVAIQQITKGQAWFVIEDDDLVAVVEEVQRNRWKAGVDIGVISYNDTSMKRIAAGGITTLSTDFSEMGKTMVKMILSGKDEQIRSVGKIIDRGSL